MKPTFAIIGCGRVGTALGRELASAGYPPAGFASRRLSSAKRTAEAAGFAERATADAVDAVRDADVVFITTPDRAIAGACGRIAGKNGFKKGSMVFHCSGSLPSTILSPAKSCGAFIGSLHPLQSIAADLDVNPFERIMMAVEGEEPAVSAAEKIAAGLGATPFDIRTEGKVLYHASAVVASNYLVTLLDLSFKLLAAAGVSEDQRFAVLNPLIRGTLNNIKTVGFPHALTGPIARGDVLTIEDHLRAMTEMPRAEELYRVLGKATIDIALAKGTLSPEAAEKIRKLLA